MASGPITSWQIDKETMETVTDFIFGGSKICLLLYGLTSLPGVSLVRTNGDCSHEI